MDGKLKEAVERSRETKSRDKYPCAYRGEPLRIHGCRPCQSRRGGVVYECALHDECTVLSYSATNSKTNSRCKVCIACDDRVTPTLMVTAEQKNRALVDESKRLVDCIHFGERVGNRHSGDGPAKELYRCNCPDRGDTATVEDCGLCGLRYPRQVAAEDAMKKNKPDEDGAEDEPKKPRKRRGRKARMTRAERRAAKLQLEGERHPADVNPEGVLDRTKRPANVANLFHNSPLFIVLSGPSLRTLDIGLLQQRGILTMGVNNAAAFMHTDLFIHGDPSKKFHDSIWKDPSIMKFTPKSMLRRDVRHRVNGSFEIHKRVMYMPNVYGYNRNSTFDPDNFLTEPTISFGNGKKGEAKNGYPRVLSTMFSAIKMSWHLGCKRVYLLGCDFNMSHGDAYAFGEEKSAGAVRSNNHAYGKIQYLLSLAKPHFDDMGFEVFNCNPKSGLQVFPHMPYEEAIESTIHGIEQEPNTEGWYAKR